MLPANPVPPPTTPAEVVPALVEALGDNAYVLDKLTVKQMRFVEEYPIDFDAAAAARRAGHPANGAKQIGYDNLRKPAIVDAITAVMACRSQANTVSRSWVMAQLVDAHEVAREKAAANASYMAHRLKALEMIGKHVDVRAFRLGAFSGADDPTDGADIWDLSLLNDEEFETFERLLAKVTIIKPSAPREGGATAEA
jgi:hypothetical protein